MSCNVTYKYNGDGVKVFTGDASRCDTGSNELTPTTLSDYKPFSYHHQPTTNFFTISGNCCYIEDPSECSSFDLTEIARGTLDSDATDITDTSYILCGKSPTSINQLTNQAISLDTTDFTTFFILIIAIFISVLLYAVFVVGPFLFWTKYAPRMNYETGCHAPKTILERHYCRDENELPYNWELLSGCEKPSKQALPSLDKCPPEHSMYSENPLGKVGGEGIWDKIVRNVGGFPYYGINKDRESLYKQYNGNLFIVSILCLSVIFSLAYGPYMVTLQRQHAAKIGCGIGLSVLLIIIPLVLSGIFKIKTTSFFYKFHSGIVGLSIVGYIVNVLINIPHFIIPIFITVGFFILLWNMGSYKNDLGKNLGFVEALLKGGYYIRKSYINSIKYSLIGGRGISQWCFEKIGNLPIPDWIYIILGKIIIPIIISIIFISRGLVSFWDAVRGLFGHLKTIKYRQKLKDEEKQSGGAKSIIETISDMGRNAKKGIADGYKSAKDSSKKTIADTVDEYNAGAYTYFKRYETGWSGLMSILSLLGLCFAIFMSFINNLFFFFSYHFIPLTYPSIILNIISCNIHKLGFLFGIGVLALCWKLVHENQTPLPKEVVIGMTITFAVLVIYNLFTKK